MLQDTGNTSLPVSFQQLVLHTPVDLLRERKRERGGGGLSIEKDIDLRRERERQWLPRVSSSSVLFPLDVISLLSNVQTYWAIIT